MFFRKKEEELADKEEILLQQYTHWWIFMVPCAWLLFSFYLRVTGSGAFTLYSLLIFDQPTAVAGSINYYIQFYLYQGSELLQEHIPESIYQFLMSIRLHPRRWISQIVMLYALYRMVRAILTFLTTKIVVTNQRVLIETGLFRPQIVEFPRMHIDAFHIRKGFISRFLDVGMLIIQASGGLTAKLPAIKTPQLLTTTVVESEHY